MDRKESDALYSRALHRKDDLEGLYVELRSKNASTRLAAAKEMRGYLERKQDLSPEAFDDLSERLLSFISSADVHEKLGGILAIEEIAVFLSGANQTQIFRFIHYLGRVFKGENMENDLLLTHVARALGQLAKSGGGLAASIVDLEANQALQWLSGDHSDSRRHAAVLLFKELAESTPALCSNYVDPFLELIWLPLSHQNIGIRYATSRALRACLDVVGKRQPESRLITYTKLSSEAHKALKSDTIDVVHAGLLAMGELFRNSGEFLRPQYREVCEIILKFCDNRSRSIRETVVSLIPSLAAYSHDEFVANYLSSCLDFVLNTLQGGHARPPAYLALGQLVLTVGRHNVQSGVMDLAIQLVRTGLGIHRNTPNHVLSAIALLAEAFGSRLFPFIPDLLDDMFVGPLTSELVDALTKVAWHISASTILIQNRLLVVIQEILKVTEIEVGMNPSPSNSNIVSLPAGDSHDIEQEVLALRILGDNNFENHNLLPFAREIVLAYTAHANSAVQKQAVLTCCSLLRRHLALQPQAKEFRRSRANLLELDQRDFFGGKPYSHGQGGMSAPNTPLQAPNEFLSPSATPFFAFSSSPTFLSPPAQSVVGQPPPALTLGPPAVRTTSRPNLAALDEEDLMLSEAVAMMQNAEKQLMAGVLERLLTLGISDPNSGVRLTVFSSLESHFDPFLAQPENVRSLSIALNDETFAVRETALRVMGRLSTRNPCVVMLCLRKTLIQLLTELQYGGTNRIESAKLLTYLITSSPRLIKLYTEPILKVLVPRLNDSEHTVASLCLSVCGSLATVSGEEPVFRKHSEAIVRVIMNALCDERAMNKREVALRALSQVLESTGMDSVILERQGMLKLLPMVLSSLTPTQTWPVRREAMKLLGTIGAIDPFQHQIYQLRREEKTESASSSNMKAASATVGQVLGPGAGTPQAHSSAGASSSSGGGGDSANTVAISALMRILRDPLQRQHHEKVIEATVFVIKSLGSQSVPFLPIVLPQFIATLRAQEDLRATLFTQLTVFVGLVKAQIRPYLGLIFQVVSEFWSDEALLLHQILLVVETTNALGDDTATYMPSLLPQLIRVLTIDSNTKVSLKILHLLQCYGANLEPYLHMIVPTLVRLLEADDADMSVRILAVRTLGCLSRVLRLSDYASRLIHPLARILESTESPFGAVSPLRREVLETLGILKHQLQDSFLIFVPMMSKVLARASADTAIMDRYQAQDVIDLPPLSAPEPSEPEPTETKKLGLNQENLKRVWDASQRTIAEDWQEWLRSLMIELLKESPAPALRACSMLAHECSSLAAVLFHAAFASCWIELQDQFQDDLVLNIEVAFSSPQVPPGVLQSLLNLAEYMEQIDQPLPLDIRTLGAVAEKCHAYAKALYYKELEFQMSPETTTESLISINNQLGQPEAAIGVLTYTKHNHQTQIKASWFEKLLRWEDALEAYERKQLEDPASLDTSLGRMRCLLALGNWPRALTLSRQLWSNPEVTEDAEVKQAVAVLACHACWNLGKWEVLADYLNAISPDSSERHFFSAVLAIRQYNFNQARTEIMRTRQLIDSPLVALVGESYTRAYRLVVQVQQLAEMEELISYKTCELTDRQALTRKMWTTRLQSCQRNVDVWLPILAVRSLVVDPHEDVPTWLKFASLCRRSGRQALALNVLTNLFGFNPRNLSAWPKVLRGFLPFVSYSYVKHLWAIDSRVQANNRLCMLVRCIDDESKSDVEFSKFKAKCYLKMGLYALEGEHAPKPEMINQVLSWFQVATALDQTSYKAWHAWAVMNFRVVVSTKQQAEALKRKARQKRSFRNAEDLTKLEAKINAHVVPAVVGFFHSIQLGGDKSLQDILRLLSLWFAHGEQREVEEALVSGFNSLSLDTWLPVLPQIIARIDTSHHTVRRTIHDLLCRIGKLHPQALILIVTVAAKSETVNRKVAASEVLANMREHSPILVEQALTVGDELIRVAILWHEMWHEALEEASRQWYTHRNVEGMMAALTPLHELMSRGPQSTKEVAFYQDYARALKEARDWCRKYARSNNERDLVQAWDLYSTVFRQIDRQLSTTEMLSVSLADVSLKLFKARDLLLAVPGTYLDEHDQNQARTREITIASFVSEVTIIESKQRPRKLSVIGIDGLKYTFLLKGHEDLRQDKRIMQLFGLINTLLANNRATSTQDLRIRGYAVIPLSPNSGLIQWMPFCDTMHAIVKEYRDQCNILLNIELRLMLRMSANYQTLTTMQKVEVLEAAMACTTGQDLARMLWLKSQSSELWLLRRNNYTRSLAIMSMVGYVLGLGDRHPCNLMLDRHSGKIIHIDFGDCFEVAMHRDKFPEKIPFRLTRMLVNAMEVSGIEGNFRIVAESVMAVLRQNGQSVMAVLEAFVYDPLVSWRLLTAKPKPKPSLGEEKELPDLGTKPEAYYSLPTTETDSEVLNTKALEVLARVESKLRGRDFQSEELDVPSQVEQLVRQATSLVNLCQCYIGWCPFW